MPWLKDKIIKWLQLDKLVTLQEFTDLQQRVSTIGKGVDRKLSILEDNTRIDVDPSLGRGNNTIVFTGVYKGKGYVRFYDVGDGEFEELVHIEGKYYRRIYIEKGYVVREEVE